MEDDDTDRRAQERVGSVLDDKWTLERLLGVGGMAAVYAARHRNGARSAIKILHPDLSRHAEVRERFQREGYAANQVEDPGAVKVLDDGVVATGADAGTAYLVMELLEGRSLQDRVEQGPTLDEVEFLEIADRILDVLRAAHARGVIHRDLKPENLFLVREDVAESSGSRVKVLDFGLARLLQGQAITTYGLALGTPSFMSPEQAAGRLDEIDGRTDLFSLAATGFRVRTGRRIHEGGNAVELVSKMASMPAPSLRSIAPDASAPFARVIDRGLAFARVDRYPTAAEMQTDVRRALSELISGPAPAEARLEETTTIEVSRGDLEPVASPRSGSADKPTRIDGSPRALPRVALVDRRALVAAPGLVRRRSIIPWVAVLLYTAIAVRLWMDGRAPQPAPGSSLEEGVTTSAAIEPVASGAAIEPVASGSSAAVELAESGAQVAGGATATEDAGAPTAEVLPALSGEPRPAPSAADAPSDALAVAPIPVASSPAASPRRPPSTEGRHGASEMLPSAARRTIPAKPSATNATKAPPHAHSGAGSSGSRLHGRNP